jgi:alpha-galactosidase
MLEIGNGGMTDDEYRVHMSLWSLLAAPLLAGNDVRHMSDATLAILTNSEVIAVDQDPAAQPAKRMVQDGDVEVWTRPLQGGSTAVGLFNRDSHSKPLSVPWSTLGLTGDLRARDLWKHEEVPVTGASYSATVPGHGVIMLEVKTVPAPVPSPGVGR